MNNSQFDRVISLAAKDTKRGARVIAKVFYRILRRKGFTQNQIIDISTNMLNCLIESQEGYEQKIESTSKKQVTPTARTKFQRLSICSRGHPYPH